MTWAVIALVLAGPSALVFAVWLAANYLPSSRSSKTPD